MAAAIERVELDGPGATEALASGFAAGLCPGDVLALTGDLGTGKTVFARGLIRAVAVASGIEVGEVPSPTYTLVQPYEFPDFTVWHFDLYRITSVEDAWELAMEDAFADGVSVIEWAEKIHEILPPASIRIRLEAGLRADARIAHIRDGRRGGAA